MDKKLQHLETEIWKIVNNQLNIKSEDDEDQYNTKLLEIGENLNLSNVDLIDYLETYIENGRCSENLVHTNKWDVQNTNDWFYLELYKISKDKYLKIITEPPHNTESLFLLSKKAANQIDKTSASEISFLFEKSYQNKSTKINEHEIIRDKQHWDFIHIEYKTSIYKNKSCFILEEDLGAIGPMGGFVDNVTKIVVSDKNINIKDLNILISKHFEKKTFFECVQNALEEYGLDCHFFLDSVLSVLKQQSISFKQYNRLAH